MPTMLTTGDESQVNTPVQTKQQRSIYDASYSEIFWKSMVAGFSLGLGKTLASLIFYVVILSLLATFVMPALDQVMQPINRIIPLLENSQQQTLGIQDQFNSLFGTYPAGGQPQDDVPLEVQ